MAMAKVAGEATVACHKEAALVRLDSLRGWGRSPRGGSCVSAVTRANAPSHASPLSLSSIHTTLSHVEQAPGPRRSASDRCSAARPRLIEGSCGQRARASLIRFTSCRIASSFASFFRTHSFPTA